MRMICRFVPVAAMLTLLGCASGQKSPLTAMTFRLKPHQELKSELQKIAQEKHLRASTLVAGVGSLEKVSLRFANQKEPTTLEGFHEVVSLTGTLSEDSMHIHMAVSDKKGQTIGGHLVEGNLVYTTLEITILEQSEMVFSREIDATYGWKELSVQKR